MVDKCPFPLFKKPINNSNHYQYSSKVLNVKTVDKTSRLGQFAWRQVALSTIPLPVIFRHDNLEEYLCVQMINIHLLSKFSSENISFCMNKCPIQYFTLTQSEGKLFQFINQFHSNGYLANNNRLDYSRLDLVYITPFRPFTYFYQILSSNSQRIKNNAYWFPSKCNKSIIAKKKQHVNNKCSTNKMIPSSSPNVCKPTTSYSRSTFFHDKEIMSYNTTSSRDSNQTIVCLSIKDIISTYFPWITTEKFVQLCRLKHIIRYKPDESTNSDLSLRLINIQQLEEYWNVFIQQSSPNTQSTSSLQSQFNQHIDEEFSITHSPSLTVDTNHHSSNIIEQSFEENSITVSSSILSQSEDSPCQMDSSQSIDDEHIHHEINPLLNQLTEIIEPQGNLLENKIETNSSQNKQEEIILSIIENKIVKRKRRRSQKCHLTLKRRKRKQSNHQMQWWINQYSIQPISILLHRVNLPID